LLLHELDDQRNVGKKGPAPEKKLLALIHVGLLTKKTRTDVVFCGSLIVFMGGGRPPP